MGLSLLVGCANGTSVIQSTEIEPASFSSDTSLKSQDDTKHWTGMFTPSTFVLFLNQLIDLSSQEYLTQVGRTDLIENYQSYMMLKQTETLDSMIYYDNDAWTIELGCFYGEGATADPKESAQGMTLVIADDIASQACPVVEQALLYTMSIFYPELDVEKAYQWIQEQEFNCESYPISDECTLMLVHFDDHYQYVVQSDRLSLD